MNGYQFKEFDAYSAEYEMPTVVTPDSKLEGQMYTRATKEGYVVFEVRADDSQPKIVFGSQTDGSGGIWFKLY